MTREAMLLSCMLLLYGCAELHSPAQYQRHHMSLIRSAESQPGEYVFEARTGHDFPADSEAAEQQRMRWLEEWLEIRGWCPAGYEVLERSSIDARDINLYRMDLRYRLKCAAIAP